MSQLLKHLPSEPSLKIDTLRLWVLGREFPEASDAFDGNWLRVVAVCSGQGSRVEVSGPILDAVSFARFLDQVTSMERLLAGEAELSSWEPNLKAVLRFRDSLGHIEGAVEITSNQLLERHRFQLSLDQTELATVRAQLRGIIAQYPIRAAGERGAS